MEDVGVFFMLESGEEAKGTFANLYCHIDDLEPVTIYVHPANYSIVSKANLIIGGGYESDPSRTGDLRAGSGG